MLVTQPYHPDLQSTSHLLTELLGAMGDEPVDFTVICGYPVLLPEGHRGGVPRSEVRGNERILRCGLRFDYKRGLLRRLLYMAAFVLSASWQLLRVRRDELVCAVTNPPFSPVWIHCLSRLRGFRYQIICHDVFPEGLVAVGKISETGPVAELWHAANRRALRGAESIVVLGRDMSELLRLRYGVTGSRLHVISHWSVNDGGGAFAPEKTALWRSLGLSGDAFVVQYSGNMGLWHDLETLVRAAAFLKDDPRIRFLFIGGGMRKERAVALALELGADNIRWLPFQPGEALTDSLACGHLALISQREGLEGIAVPCKLYGILASGRGILAMVPQDCEVARVVAEEACGLRLDPDDAPALAREIRRLSESPDEVRALGARSYAAFDRKYRLGTAARAYRRLWTESGGCAGA
ncbi:MAG: glycosyltransferase family 4 protein [Verrucomicrobia bacterium]|nr:glycosyltransferase family 4 protein [Verrucomicrobiota bacterium]